MNNKIARTKNRIVCFGLSVILMFESVGCGVQQNEQQTVATVSSPEINITVFDETEDMEDRLNHGIEEGDIDDIYSMVCSSVEVKLETVGFQCAPGVAQTIENDNYSGLGMYYYDEELSFFSDATVKSVGFVEIVPEEYDLYCLDKEKSMIVVDPVDNNDPDINYICTYNYDNIGSNHFVYQNKYVTYYQQSPMRVVYRIRENVEENYDLGYGSLYDYDNKEFIYDESIFTEEYQHHSAIPLFTEEDYDKLEERLVKMSEEQEKAGFIVEEYNIVYISPESIQAYLDSEEESTFFGYSVEELSEAFGVGTALEYTTDGFKQAEILEPTETYNWKNFLKKVGVGAGIIIIGAVISPVLGGPAFGCALITIAKTTVVGAAVPALINVAVETAIGMMDGKTLSEALYASKDSGLDTFANSFLLMSAISTVGVVSGSIKPSACFAGDTLVKKYNGIGGYIYVPIEDIKIGDYVASYNEDMKQNVVSKISGLVEHETIGVIELTVNGEVITTTPDHPFYLYGTNSWMRAGDLNVGDRLQDDHGGMVFVEAVNARPERIITVYNLTVEDSHTYFVGKNSILVHNECDASIKRLRNKAVRDAWKKEVEAVKNNTSKYNWTAAEKEELLSTGKVSGYDGHHIRTVKELVNTAKEELIGSADDIVFLKESDHLYVHNGNPQNPTDIKRLVELVPWITERFEVLGIV